MTPAGRHAIIMWWGCTQSVMVLVKMAEAAISVKAADGVHVVVAYG